LPFHSQQHNFPIEITTEKEPTYIIETQPPNLYRKQKPYDAITFSPDGVEYTQTTTRAPPSTQRAVKTRHRTSVKHDKQEKNAEVFTKRERTKVYQQSTVTQASPTPAPTPRPSPRPTKAPAPKKSEEELIQELLQQQLQEQITDQDNPFKTLKVTLPASLTPDQIANLPQLAGLGDSYTASQSQDSNSPVYLNDGQNIKVLQGPPTLDLAPKRKGPEIRIIHEPSRAVPTAPTTTVKPPEELFEELRKGVLPPGADFELIRQKQDGGLEEVGKLQNLPQKKVTFVILEEQPDGSVKVQGVRGNENGGNGETAPDVDSIIKKIQEGEIKLPPSTKLSGKKESESSYKSVTPQASVASPSYVKHYEKNAFSKQAFQPTVGPKVTNIVYEKRKQVQASTTVPTTTTTTTTQPSPVYYQNLTPSPHGVVNSHAGPVFAMRDTPSTTEQPIRRTTTERPKSQQTGRRTPPKSNPAFLPTVAAAEDQTFFSTRGSLQEPPFFEPRPTVLDTPYFVSR
jgi:hypothetical protein